MMIRVPHVPRPDTHGEPEPAATAVDAVVVPGSGTPDVPGAREGGPGDGATTSAGVATSAASAPSQPPASGKETHDPGGGARRAEEPAGGAGGGTAGEARGESPGRGLDQASGESAGAPTGAAPGDSPDEGIGEPPVERPAERPVEPPAERPVERPVETSAGQSLVPPLVESAAEPPVEVPLEAQAEPCGPTEASRTEGAEDTEGTEGTEGADAAGGSATRAPGTRTPVNRTPATLAPATPTPVNRTPATRTPANRTPAKRPALPRLALLGHDPADEHGPPMARARELAAAGTYVLLVVPAWSGPVTTAVTRSGGGIVRVLRVPCDPDLAAEVTAARNAALLVPGKGVGAGLRRRAAGRRLRRVRARARRAAERAGAAWGLRCAEAFRPYVDAFAPGKQAAVDRAPRVIPGLTPRLTSGLASRPAHHGTARAATGVSAPVTPRVTPPPAGAARPGTPGQPGDTVSLGIGPSNAHGQGVAWARAVTAHLPGVRAEALGLTSGQAHGGVADVPVTTDEWLSPRWQLGRVAHVLDTYTHVVAEGALPAFGRLNGPWADGDLDELRAAGVAVALALHGPEARDPARHRARVTHSPFDPEHPLTRRLQARADTVGRIVRTLGVPVFVSSPDLLADLPDAVWLPVVVDPERWHTTNGVLRRPRPVVVHGVNSPFLHGACVVEPVLRELHDAGLIVYRNLRRVAPRDLPAVLAGADIVLDDFALGTYGPLTVRALAAGRLTMSYLDPSVAGHLPDDPPIAGAGPREVRDAILRAIEERDAARELAARGPAYVRAHHDGRRSARVLADFLGVPRTPDGDPGDAAVSGG